jgi:hypothetical protein
MARRIALVLCLLAGLVTAVAASPISDQQTAIDNVLKLVRSGVSDQVIIRHIQAQHYVFELSTDDLLSLRDQGVSDAVLGAMLDTAIDEQSVSTPAESTTTEVASPATTQDDDQTPVYLSAGYYSPWYRYPYAWGYYYDPFPMWYSTFYYPPFYLSFNWGWYGGCNYWYAGYWPHYGWHDPYYYHYARSHHGYQVPVPRPHYADVIPPGGSAGHRGVPAPRPHGIGTARHSTSAAAPYRALGTPTLDGRMAGPRVHVRSPGRVAAPAALPASHTRNGAPVRAPSPAPRHVMPPGGNREGAPAAAPRRAPRIDFGGRSAAPAHAPMPRFSMPSSGGGMHAAPSVRVPTSMPASRAAAPAAPHGGGGHLR